MLLLGKDDEQRCRTAPNLIVNLSSAAEPKRAGIKMMVRPKLATRRIELRGDGALTGLVRCYGIAPVALYAGGQESRADRNSRSSVATAWVPLGLVCCDSVTNPVDGVVVPSTEKL